LNTALEKWMQLSLYKQCTSDLFSVHLILK